MSTLREVVPWGRELPEADFAIRHRLVRVVLAAHLPVLAAVALAVGEGALRTLAELTPLAVLLAAATVRLPARVRALAASLGPHRLLGADRAPRRRPRRGPLPLLRGRHARRRLRGRVDLPGGRRLRAPRARDRRRPRPRRGVHPRGGPVDVGHGPRGR